MMVSQRICSHSLTHSSPNVMLMIPRWSLHLPLFAFSDSLVFFIALYNTNAIIVAITGTSRVSNI